MAIQIVDNFQVNIAQSIDNRLVVGPSQFYTDKDDLPYKYAGMRVWDLNSGVSGVPYVWTGTTFSTESSSGIAGGGTNGFIPKFIGGGNELDDSIIRESSGNIGIGISPTKKLHVNGDIKSDGASGFYGKGSNITLLNATNITSGTLQLNYLSNGTTNQILTAGASPQWTNPATITVGNATKVYHVDDSITTSARQLLFLNGSSGVTGYDSTRNSARLTFTPDVGGGDGSLYINGYLSVNTTYNSLYRLNVSGNTKLSGGMTVQTRFLTRCLPFGTVHKMDSEPSDYYVTFQDRPGFACPFFGSPTYQIVAAVYEIQPADNVSGRKIIISNFTNVNKTVRTTYYNVFSSNFSTTSPLPVRFKRGTNAGWGGASIQAQITLTPGQTVTLIYVTGSNRNAGSGGSYASGDTWNVLE